MGGGHENVLKTTIILWIRKQHFNHSILGLIRFFWSQNIDTFHGINRRKLPFQFGGKRDTFSSINPLSLHGQHTQGHEWDEETALDTILLINWNISARGRKLQIRTHRLLRLNWRLVLRKWIQIVKLLESVEFLSWMWLCKVLVIWDSPWSDESIHTYECMILDRIHKDLRDF